MQQTDGFHEDGFSACVGSTEHYDPVVGQQPEIEPGGEFSYNSYHVTAGGASAGRMGPAGPTTTNVQERGVDEADTVETDGRYIYTVRNREVLILKSWPASEAISVKEEKKPKEGIRVTLRNFIMWVSLMNLNQMSIPQTFGLKKFLVSKTTR